jgi:hypothetical protein
MTTPKKEHPPMHTATAAVRPKLPTPQVEQSKKMVQAECRTELVDAVEAEIKKRGVTKRSVVEFGIERWLCEVAPHVAKKLGIGSE